jgi:acylphosphatase
VRCRIRGRVQGVFFRDSTRRLAVSLGLRGHALNMPDGSVEVVACGGQEAVAVLRGWLAEGPPRAHVDVVECLPLENAVPNGFRVG